MALSNLERLIPLLSACAALAACGAESVESPSGGGNITINNPPAAAPSPAPTTPTTPTLVTPASGCPTIEDPAGLADRGTITGPTGTYRVCELPARFTRSTTLARIPGLLYSLNGRVDVGLDRGAAPTTDAPVVLTLQPGVVAFASTGASWLAVNRGNRINAAGTATQPIVFTSRDNVLGLATDDSQGQWGGIVLLGRAPVTDCTVAPAATPGTVNCERQTEGAVDPAYFGGATPNDNSGRLRYVQIRYSGYVLSGDSELQSLTLGGVGSGTTISHIQSHNSSDDGFENFGGFVYVRGLGDRYSSALLNGLPLPSPEPLRRAVPLDLFPTDVIASSLVQKTYSPNDAGEFGGGVINLTTLAVPDAPFFGASVGFSGDTETTGQLGYQYYGSDTDWSGYDDGARFSLSVSTRF